MGEWCYLARRRPFVFFRPGEWGSPLRGDRSAACLTIASTSDLGTCTSFLITLLKCWNSGVDSNGAGFILAPFYARFEALGGFDSGQV